MWRVAPLLWGLLLGCGGFDRSASDADGPEPVTVVEVAPVATGEVSETLVTSAVVESEIQADLLPVTTGIVRSIHVEEGDRVEAGALLAVIDNVSLEAGAERASAELRHLEQELARLERLYTQGAISQRELTDARHRLDTARSSSREAQRSHGQTRITAPFDGVVAFREIRVGELASSSQRAFQVVDLDRLRVVASLPERDLARVRVGQRARLVAAYDETIGAWATVERVGPVVDSASGTFRVTLALEAEQSALRPGQYVSVRLEVDRRRDVVVLPRKGLAWEDGTPVAYRMAERPPEDEGDEEEAPGWIAERVRLSVGLVDDEGVEILDGLSPGDRVVVVGQSNLREGARIRTPGMQAEHERRQAEDAAADGAEG